MFLSFRHSLFTIFTLLLLCLSHPAWAANTIDVSLAKNNLILTPIHGGNGAAWGRDRCNSCHIINSIHKDAPQIRDIVKSKGYPSCAGCHGTNGVDSTVRACVLCHNAQDLPQSPLMNESKNHNFDTNTDASLSDKDCLSCHLASDMDGDFENNVDLTKLPDQAGVATPYAKQTDFCLRCHNQNHQQPEFRIKNTDPNNALSASEVDFLSIDVHGERNGSGTTVYNGLRNGYTYQSSVDCTDCHAMHSTHNDKLIIGDSSAGVFRLDQAFRNAKHRVNVRQDDDSQLCVLCHVMKTPIGQADKDTGNGLAGVHLTGAGSNCRECHAHGKNEQDLAVNNTTNNRMNGNLILTPTHGKNGNGTAWGITQCDACHSISLIHKDAPNIKDIVLKKGYATCMGCHGSNGTVAGANNTSNPNATGQVNPDAIPKCTICHNVVDLPVKPDLNTAKNHSFVARKEQPLNDAMCIGCHDASDMNGLFELNKDLTHFPNKAGRIVEYNNSSEFCISCHNLDHQQPIAPITGALIENFSARHPLVAMEINWSFLDVHGKRKGSGERTYAGLRADIYKYSSLVECVDCHVMHGTHNDKLIIDSTAKGVFKFPDFARKTPYLIDTPNGDYSQLCVTCHSMKDLVEQGAQNTGNGISGVHQVGTDCRECHTHGMAAQTGL
ncbi:MAG: hypothetical protein HOP02_09675 [Methylococcaceae bacterium]|nr:hypothetical protein [Methylococcaceae bacterium]